MQEDLDARDVTPTSLPKRRAGIRALAAFAITAFAFVLDRATKQIFLKNLPPFGIPGLIEPVDHHNFGLIANFPVPRLLIIIGTTIIITWIIWRIIRRTSDMTARDIFPLALLIGGAIGNLYDRIFFGFVFDWILLFGRSAVNLADAAVALGIVWFVIISRSSQSSNTEDRRT